MSRAWLADLAAILIAALVALAIRTFVASIYVIPSDSMRPGLMTGDYLLVEKWPYRSGRALPARGDVVVFAAPPSGRRAYIKRVIGLPGDRVALRGGIVRLNGRALPRWRIADSLEPIAPNAPCSAAPGLTVEIEHAADAVPACRMRRYREMLPGGRMADLIDLGPSEGDDFAETIVPVGRLFVLGDNRDRSADSRWPAKEGEAVGMVPAANLIGRAGRILLSVNGTARWRDPASWVGAIRWERLGRGD